MKFKLGTKVVSSRKENGKVSLDLEAPKGGKQETIQADVVLVATPWPVGSSPVYRWARSGQGWD